MQQRKSYYTGATLKPCSACLSENIEFSVAFLKTLSLKLKTTSLCNSLFSYLTGGLLIASAHFGAYVCGMDIDYSTVHGLGMFFHYIAV